MSFLATTSVGEPLPRQQIHHPVATPSAAATAAELTDHQIPAPAPAPVGVAAAGVEAEAAVAAAVATEMEAEGVAVEVGDEDGLE